MSPQTPSIRVPHERMAQIKMIAEKRSMSYAELIAYWIEREIEDGTIPREVPGVTVRREADQIIVEMGAISRSIRRDVAASFADNIRGVAGLARETAEALGGLQVRKRGRGIKITDIESGAELATSPSVARDIAALIDKAAEGK